MNVWWLLLIVPVCGIGGAVPVCLFAGQAYARGFDDGHCAGWEGAMSQENTPEVPS